MKVGEKTHLCLPQHDQNKKNYQSLRITEFLGEKRAKMFFKCELYKYIKNNIIGEVGGRSDRGNAVDGGMDA